MKNLIKVLAVITALVLALGCLASCGGKTEEGATDAATSENAAEAKLTAKDGVLVMATNASFPPYEFVGDDGEFAGIDVEIAGLIAEKLGLKLEIQDVEFGSIIGGVQSGKGIFRSVKSSEEGHCSSCPYQCDDALGYHCSIENATAFLAVFQTSGHHRALGCVESGDCSASYRDEHCRNDRET